MEVSMMRIVRWILIGAGVAAAVSVIWRLVTGRKEKEEGSVGVMGVEQSHVA
jgi:hypothetical protein